MDVKLISGATSEETEIFLLLFCLDHLTEYEENKRITVDVPMLEIDGKIYIPRKDPLE